MFTDKTIHKTYLCIVKGNFSDENLEGRIENLIGRDTKDRKKMAVVKENGKLAISNYRVVEQVKDYSLVRSSYRNRKNSSNKSTYEEYKPPYSR